MLAAIAHGFCIRRQIIWMITAKQMIDPAVTTRFLTLLLKNKCNQSGSSDTVALSDWDNWQSWIVSFLPPCSKEKHSFKYSLPRWMIHAVSRDRETNVWNPRFRFILKTHKFPMLNGAIYNGWGPFYGKYTFILPNLFLQKYSRKNIAGKNNNFLVQHYTSKISMYSIEMKLLHF